MKSPFLFAVGVLTCGAMLAPARAQGVGRPPAVKQAAARPSAATLSAKRLKSLATMLTMYVQDNRNVYPAMRTPQALRKALTPYTKLYGAAAFVQPGANRSYLPNPLLSGVRAKIIRHPEGVVAFYEPVPAPDGSRLICTADGRIGRMTGANWAQYQKMLNLP